MAKIVDRIFNTVLTADDSTAQEELGAFRFENGKIYKYVQYMDAVTATAGSPCLMDGTYNHKVTIDQNAGVSDTVQIVVGNAMTTHTPEYYGWMQIYGVGVISVTDANKTGDWMIPNGTDKMWGKGVSTATSDAAVDITALSRGAVALEDGSTADVTISAFIRCM